MATNQLTDSYWMPFTAMRDFRAAPRMLIEAQGHYYTDEAGRQVYDSFSGLWTTGVGHCHPHIVNAVQKQVAELDYAIGFQMSHPKPSSWVKDLSTWRPKASGQLSLLIPDPSPPTRR